MRPPIGGCLLRRFALLHFFGRRAFSQGNDFPFLRLIWKLDRFDERMLRLGCNCGAFGGDEVFCRVHFLPFVLKERTCSLHQAPREQVRSARKAPVSVRAAGQRSTKQRSATRHKQTGCAKRIGERLCLVARGCAEQPEARALTDEHDRKPNRRMPIIEKRALIGEQIVRSIDVENGICGI